ncbi:MAG: AbrB/MazE/SpoVT family DNA-binding domain-containing protein [Acetivibrionales bacterium]|jgi:transcriptional pleiotropic regulator of transition state genes
MKATGIVRKLDNLVRVVLPVDLRRMLGVSVDDPLNIAINGNEIILTKHVQKCIFCRGEKDVIEKMGHYICKQCISEI